MLSAYRILQKKKKEKLILKAKWKIGPHRALRSFIGTHVAPRWECPRVPLVTAIAFLRSSSARARRGAGFNRIRHTSNRSGDREARAEFRVINASPIGGCVHCAVLSRDCVKGQNVKYSNPEARLRERPRVHRTPIVYDRDRARSLLVSEERSLPRLNDSFPR